MSTKNNAKAAAAEAPAALTMEQMLEGYLKMKAEKEAAEKRAAEAEAKAAKAVTSAISLSKNGGINVTVPSGKGSVTLHYYVWQWSKISAMRDEIDAFAKKNADKLTTEAAFRSREK